MKGFLRKAFLIFAETFQDMLTEHQEQLLTRITIRPGMMNGKPIIRNMRFPVGDILEMLSSGMSAGEILEEHPILEAEDISAALLFASLRVNNKMHVNAA